LNKRQSEIDLFDFEFTRFRIGEFQKQLVIRRSIGELRELIVNDREEIVSDRLFRLMIGQPTKFYFRFRVAL